MMRGGCTWLVLGGALLMAGSACEPTPPEDRDRGDVLSHLPRYEAQLEVLCARGRDDAVTAAFCGAGPPAIAGLTELQRVLDLEFGEGPRPNFALTGHSSSLAARHVSPINPRAIIFKFADQRVDDAVVSMGYARGDNTVELAVTPAGGQQAGEIHFYLLRYEQECTDSDAGCALGDTLTPATETGWTRWSLYDDVDLENSVLDCRHCHQPQGPGTRSIFRMQELPNPWTHWFAGFTDGGRLLYQDYRGAHGGDGYAGIPGNILGAGSPILVDNLVKETLSEEIDGEIVPIFESRLIEGEVAETGTSPTWQALYDRAVAGEIIPPPFRDIEVTDPDKLRAMSAAYASFVAGERPDLPDIRDVFKDDALAGMSFVPAPGLDARGILRHACAQCHNGKLQQDISRAKFNALDVDNLSGEQRQAIIERLTLPPENRFRMPPAQFRDLPAAELEAVLQFLQE